jgi:hypothetical protein
VVQYGEDAVKDGMGSAGMSGGAGGMGDLFEMFNGGARSRQPRGPPRGENVQHRLKVTLEDMYRGTTRYGIFDPSTPQPFGVYLSASLERFAREKNLARYCGDSVQALNAYALGQLP